ncbi:MAG TPA: hypothetical protein VOA41_19280 [Candidatus Dormibacteraeota bacterium]|nr:hypothetical protein [Candidatus Dormibacteraeota bacterium]
MANVKTRNTHDHAAGGTQSLVALPNGGYEGFFCMGLQDRDRHPRSTRGLIAVANSVQCRDDNTI